MDDTNTFLSSYVSGANLLKATEHLTNIANLQRLSALSETDAARRCIIEATKGIDLLKCGRSVGSSDVLDMLSKLREQRATYLNTANSDDMQLNAKKTSAKLENNIRLQMMMPIQQSLI